MTSDATSGVAAKRFMFISSRAGTRWWHWWTRRASTLLGVWMRCAAHPSRRGPTKI